MTALGLRDHQRDKTLGMLQDAGVRGVTNFQLRDVSLRYGARLFELRAGGHKIKTVRVTSQEFKYILEK